MKDFRELVVWQGAHSPAVVVYKATKSFPKEELYGLTSQMRGACVSIPAKIVEGCGRGSDADFARFVHIAMGTACELEYPLLLAQELDFLERTDFDRLSGALVEIKKMLSGLIGKLKASSLTAES